MCAQVGGGRRGSRTRGLRLKVLNGQADFFFLFFGGRLRKSGDAFSPPALSSPPPISFLTSSSSSPTAALLSLPIRAAGGRRGEARGAGRAGRAGRGPRCQRAVSVLRLRGSAFSARGCGGAARRGDSRPWVASAENACIPAALPP